MGILKKQEKEQHRAFTIKYCTGFWIDKLMTDRKIRCEYCKAKVITNSAMTTWNMQLFDEIIVQNTRAHNW